MGISKAKKRKIYALDRDFYWCVKKDPCCERHDGANYIQVINEEKSFLIEMPIEKDNRNCIFVTGKEFSRPIEGMKCIERYPKYLYGNGVSPQFVSNLIVWCLNNEANT